MKLSGSNLDEVRFLWPRVKTSGRNNNLCLSRNKICKNSAKTHPTEFKPISGRTAQTSANALSPGEVISSMFSRQGCDILCVLIHCEKTNENLLDYQMNSQLEG